MSLMNGSKEEMNAYFSSNMKLNQCKNLCVWTFDMISFEFYLIIS